MRAVRLDGSQWALLDASRPLGRLAASLIGCEPSAWTARIGYLDLDYWTLDIGLAYWTSDFVFRIRTSVLDIQINILFLNYYIIRVRSILLLAHRVNLMLLENYHY